MAVAPDGTVYVADRGNHRIQRFNAASAFLGTWGSRGHSFGQFNEPSGVAVARDDMVYVADRGNHRIQRFSASGNFRGPPLGWARGTGPGEFSYPFGVAVAPDGTVYVADTGNSRIQRFSASGTFLGTWGRFGSGDGQFSEPRGVAVAPDGTVYVADSGNHRIQRFSATGTFLGAWGSNGSSDGQFSYAEGVAVAPDGTVYVADSGNHRIQAFGTQHPAAWRGEFFGNDWLTGPVLHVENVPDRFLNLSWSDRPAANVPADHFTSRWLRYVNFPTAGSYHFTIRADDGVRFWVDDRLVVDSWQPQSITREITVELSAGYHRLLLEHWDRDGGATLALEWTSTDNATPIPSPSPMPTPMSPLLPASPSNLRSTGFSAGGIMLAWNDNSDNETGFYLYRWDGSVWVRIATLGANVTTYTDTDPNCGQSRYRVSAYNIAGESAMSNEVAVAIRCPLILIPGIMGSYIYQNRKQLWPGIGDTSRDNLLRNLGPKDVIVRDAIRTYVFLTTKTRIYSPLIDFLKGEGYIEYPPIDNEQEPSETLPPLERCKQAEQDGQKPTLFVFAYDWRQSNRVSAQNLQEYIECVRSIHNNSRVDIIAHSMGGLVARRYLIDNPSNHGVARLITIATPFYGAARTITVITTGKFPGVTDFSPIPKIYAGELKYVAETAAGAHELLPSPAYGEQYQCFLEFEGAIIRIPISRKCATYGEFVSWINGYARGSGSNTYGFHIGAQDNWTNDANLNPMPEYYHFVGILRGISRGAPQNTLSKVAEEKLCIFNLPLIPICGRRVLEKSYDQGDGTVPIKSAEHQGYR
ncbi:MAG: alpha/beta hydrolase, partial [Roseiflexus sp.]|nr:alpha/beta hydrolase [Roseiflexus sp.]